MKRQFENRELIATRNMLRMNASSSHHAAISGFTFNNGANDFTISFLAQIDGIVAQAILTFYNASAGIIVGSGFGVGKSFAVSSSSNIYGEVGPLSNTFQKAGVVQRYTIIRRGNNMEFWINMNLIHTLALVPGDLFNLGSMTNFHIGSYDGSFLFLNGFVANLIVLSSSLSYGELSHLNNTNVIPSTHHDTTLGHWPLNQNYGSVFYDVVEQYNYSKTIPYLDANIQSGDYAIFPVVGATPTLNFGSDGDGNYLEFIGGGAASNYIQAQAAAGLVTLGTTYTLKLKVKRVAGVGYVGVEQFGNGVVVEYLTITNTPNGTLVDLEFVFTSPGTGANSLPVFNMTTSTPGGIDCTIRVYRVEVTGVREANHGNLVNYTAAELGTDNTLLQTAWRNIYAKAKRSINYLQGDAVDIRAEIPSFINQTFAEWTLFIDFFPVRNQNASALFYNQTPSDVPNYVLLDIDVNGQIGAYLGDSVPINGAGATSQGRNRIMIQSSNAEGASKLYRDGILRSQNTFSPNTFQKFCFLSTGAAGFSNAGICRAIFYNKILTEYERNILLEAANDDRYDRIGAAQFDIDFGDAFESGGNYFARDNSGNARHAQLYNYVPATDQPLRIEQHTGLPERRKALKFNGTNQYLSVANFNPTKEKGYTYIVQFKDLATDGRAGALFAKFGNPPYLWKYIYTIKDNPGGNNNFVQIGDYLGTQRAEDVFFKKTDVLQSIAYTINSVEEKIYPNGFKTAANSPFIFHLLGFDEVGIDDLRIGDDASNNLSNYQGYISHLSIYKGVLRQSQILDIINNGLHGNASRESMTDCHLYLNFEELINDAGIYKVKDWSPQNRTVVMNNYTANDINPVHMDYKLFNLDSLR